METTDELKGRFESAFRRYSVQTTRLRELRASLPDPAGSVDLHILQEHLRAQDKAEFDYRSVRLEYARRLLGTVDGQSRLRVAVNSPLAQAGDR